MLATCWGISPRTQGDLAWLVLCHHTHCSCTRQSGRQFCSVLGECWRKKRVELSRCVLLHICFSPQFFRPSMSCLLKAGEQCILFSRTFSCLFSFRQTPFLILSLKVGLIFLMLFLKSSFKKNLNKLAYRKQCPLHLSGWHTMSTWWVPPSTRSPLYITIVMSWMWLIKTDKRLGNFQIQEVGFLNFN